MNGMDDFGGVIGIEQSSEALAEDGRRQLEDMQEAERAETTEACESSTEGTTEGSTEGYQALEPETYMTNTNEVVMVTGNPFGLKGEIDYNQGDNPYGAAGNCGLVSISNALRRMGYQVTEDDVTRMAISKGLCEYDPFNDMSDNGGTTRYMRHDLLTQLGVKTEIVYPDSGGSLEDIARHVDNGDGVVLSVNAGELWQCDDGTPYPMSNHCVTVTGVVRSGADGDIIGVTIADSGRGNPDDACRFISRDEFDAAYTSAYNTSANIIYKA